MIFDVLSIGSKDLRVISSTSYLTLINLPNYSQQFPSVSFAILLNQLEFSCLASSKISFKTLFWPSILTCSSHSKSLIFLSKLVGHY